MSLRDKYPKARLPTSHYFLSVARGENLRTFAVRPLAIWSFAAIVPVLLAWGVGAGLFIAFHDDMLGVVVARQADMQYAYEDRLAAARAQLDRVTSRQLLDQNSFEGKMHDLLSRQALLEQRTSIVASLARDAGLGETTASIARPRPVAALAVKPAGNALSAIGAARAATASDSDLDDVRGYAPTESEGGRITIAPGKPRPLDEPRAGAETKERTSALPDPDLEAAAELNSAATNSDIAAPTRLSLISSSLDSMDKRQIAVLGRIERVADANVSRLRGVIADAGVSPDRVAGPADKAEAKGGMGGPYIPMRVDAGAPAFDKAVASVARTVAQQDRLRAIIPYMPLRRPLVGEADVSSPFGYRPDPFLGRPALHPGVDLVQEWGASVHATGAGRVVHAGWMGGYGNMVEIDHGDGLATRYGHLSSVLVEEGQQVEPGALLGKLGSTGRSTGPHLHYEVRVDGEPVDPVRFLKAGNGLLASE
jgi:murein DD-endopeptidase MepM/ murein hydrolase activator NlpD